ncbi:MAG: D-cysteine desulfhydrase family protein [Candidatus Marinimicrobia bacterium]|nr:D-cysteine desulfhydrase family protein [Candidatus Neomarinimicrobiota bacterium]
MQLIDDLLKPFPKEKVSVLPTPFYRMNDISDLLGSNVYIKRDDLTGFAFGGNKTRKFDFLVADALAKGCNTIVGIGANQSNFCRILSGVGAKYGLAVHLVLSGAKPKTPTGNLLIDHLFGAIIHHVDTIDPVERMEEALQVKNQLEYQGKKVYFLPPGGSIPRGALGYVAGWGELMDDFEMNHLEVSTIIHASSSAGTQAGLVVGQAITGWPGQIIGMSVDVPRQTLEKDIFTLAQATGNLVNINVERELVRVDDSYIGKGYGIRTAECEEAVTVFSRHEGIFLDYVYTGKAAAGLFDYANTGKFTPDENVVFLHTGGNIELFE